MLAFSDYNPIAVFLYYLCVVMLCVFCMSPVTALISLAGALGLWFMKYGKKDPKSHIFTAFMFLLLTVGNPLFSHNGKTVLFVMNTNPVTLEALYYGAVMGLMLASSLYWFKSFTLTMTSDKILYIFGRISPKTALILSMTMRMLPLFREQAAKTDDAQKGMGLYKDENYIQKFKGKAKVFSVMLTWATENAVVTADSMASRGYSGERRTNYAIYRFTRRDAAFTALTALLAVPFIIALGKGTIEFGFYPSVTIPENTFLTVSAYVCYAILCFIPVITEAGDRIRWKYLQSKI